MTRIYPINWTKLSILKPPEPKWRKKMDKVGSCCFADSGTRKTRFFSPAETGKTGSFNAVTAEELAAASAWWEKFIYTNFSGFWNTAVATLPEITRAGGDERCLAGLTKSYIRSLRRGQKSWVLGVADHLFWRKVLLRICDPRRKECGQAEKGEAVCHVTFDMPMALWGVCWFSPSASWAR